MMKDVIVLIEDMYFRGCLFDKVSFYIVMVFFCKENNMVEIRVLFKKMMGYNLLLDMVIYNNFIYMFCKYGYSDEVCVFLREV